MVRDQPPPVTRTRTTARPAHTHTLVAGQRLSSMTRIGVTFGPPTSAVWPIRTAPSTGRLGGAAPVVASRVASATTNIACP